MGRPKGTFATKPKYKVTTINDDGTEDSTTYNTLEAIVVDHGITKPCMSRIVRNKVKKVEDKPKGGRSKSRKWLINHRVELL